MALLNDLRVAFKVILLPLVVGVLVDVGFAVLPDGVDLPESLLFNISLISSTACANASYASSSS